MFLCGLAPLLRIILKLVIRSLRREKKSPGETELVEKCALETLQVEKMKLMAANQRLEQENDLLYLKHMKTLIGMRTEIGR